MKVTIDFDETPFDYADAAIPFLLNLARVVYGTDEVDRWIRLWVEGWLFANRDEFDAIELLFEQMGILPVDDYPYPVLPPALRRPE